jgi:hypothetical protein
MSAPFDFLRFHFAFSDRLDGGKVRTGKVEARIPRGVDEVDRRECGHAGQGSNSDLAPTLKVNGRTYKANANSTLELGFHVPVTELIQQPGDGLRMAEATLIVPYRTGIWPFRSRHEGLFKVMVGLLPSSFGKITFWQKFTGKMPEEVDFDTQTWIQVSSHDDIPDNPQLNTHKYEGPSHPGYTVKPGSASFITEWSDGRPNNGSHDDWDWRYELVRENPTVIYGVATVKRSIDSGDKKSGKVKFHFHYKLTRTVDMEFWKSQDVSLVWGGSQSFDLTGDKWRVTYDSFEGKHEEIIAPQDGKFISVDQAGGQVTVKLKIPTEALKILTQLQ